MAEIYHNYGIVDIKIKFLLITTETYILITSGNLKRTFNQSLAIVFPFLNKSVMNNIALSFVA